MLMEEKEPLRQLSDSEYSGSEENKTSRILNIQRRSSFLESRRTRKDIF